LYYDAWIHEHRANVTSCFKVKSQHLGKNEKITRTAFRVVDTLEVIPTKSYRSAIEKVSTSLSASH